MLEYWELWFPSAGATGLLFARCRVNAADAGDRVLVHAAPPRLDVLVRDPDGRVLARGDGLSREQQGPMSALARAGTSITIEDLWPDDRELGRVVLLGGGEAGVLKAWWHAQDRTEWRWQLEFYNSRR